jgi:hypothetical protein
MVANLFQVAVVRAASSFADDVWRNLSVTEQCHAIYRELRKLDAEVRGETPNEIAME